MYKVIIYHCCIYILKVNKYCFDHVYSLLLTQVSLSNNLHCCLTWNVDLQYVHHRVSHLKVFYIGSIYCLALVGVWFWDGRCVSVCVRGALWVSVMLWVQAQPPALSWMSSPLCLLGFSTANLCLWWGYRVNMVFYQQESDSPQLSTSISLNHTHTRKHTQVSHSAIRTHQWKHRNTGVSHS